MNELDGVKEIKNKCGCALNKKKKKSSLCDAIEVGLSFLLKCESKLMHFFPAIAKLASFQVTGSNVNPDRAADVKNRLANKKDC